MYFSIKIYATCFRPSRNIGFWNRSQNHMMYCTDCLSNMHHHDANSMREFVISAIFSGSLEHVGMASGVHERGKYVISFLYPDTCLKTMSWCHQSWQFCQIDLVCMMQKLTIPGIFWFDRRWRCQRGFGRLLTSSAMKVKKFCVWTVWTYFHFLDTRTHFSKRNSQHAMTFLCWSRSRTTFGQT